MTKKSLPKSVENSSTNGGGSGDIPEQDEQDETLEEEEEEKQEEEEITEKQLLAEMLNELKETRKENAILNDKIHKMNENLVAGYKATENVLKVNLEPLAAVGKQAQAQLQNQQAGVAQTPPQYQAGGGGGFVQQTPSGQYYRPQGMGQGQMMQGGQVDPMYAMEFIKMMMQPDPSQNMFNQLGQRMFAEMVTTNMMNNRAMQRKLMTAGLLTQDEVKAFEGMQDTMYKPLLGQGQANGQQPQQQQQQSSNQS